jgi:hypothetical protein
VNLTDGSGAVDASVVKDPGKINWNKVVEFPPLLPAAGFSSYLQWAIPISGFAVSSSPLASFFATHGIFQGQRISS